MLERTAYGMLVSWMREGQDSALLVDGARQIGKTYLIEEFAIDKGYDMSVKLGQVPGDVGLEASLLEDLILS